jgi:hypothetical protein
MAKYQQKKKGGNPMPPKPQGQSKVTSQEISAKPWDPTLVFWIHIGIVLAFLFIVRINLFDLPLERDESAYAYLGQRAGEGLAPYRDFYEMKPPFLFYGYALLNAVFGYSLLGLRLSAWFLSLLICGGVYLIARSFFGAKYGLLAAVTMALLSASPFVSMTFAESELLVMAVVLYGIWLLCLLLTQPSSSLRQERLRLIGAGALIGSAVMIKQSAVFFLGFAALALVLLANGDQIKQKLGKLITNGLWFSLGAIAPVLICLAIIWGFGVWDEFSFWNIEYPQLYTSRSASTISWQKTFSSNFIQIIQYQMLLWVLGGLGILALLLRGLNLKLSIALWGLLLFSFLTIVPGQRFYLHYWIQFVPAVALVIANLFFQLEKLGQKAGFSAFKNLSFPIAGLSILVVMATSAPLWLNGNSTAIMRTMYGGNPFPEHQLISRLIDSSIQPNETVAVMGSEPQFYVYLKRKAPSRHFYLAFLSSKHRFIEEWQEEALQGLTTQKPDYIVFNIVPLSWMLHEDSNQRLYQSSYSWAMQNYTPIAWVDLADFQNPTFISDASATTYKPTGSNYIMVLKKKK